MKSPELAFWVMRLIKDVFLIASVLFDDQAGQGCKHRGVGNELAVGDVLPAKGLNRVDLPMRTDLETQTIRFIVYCQVAVVQHIKGLSLIHI